MSFKPNEMMMDLFRSEVESHSEALTSSLLALEQDPTAAAALERMMRAAHSIKGAARIVMVPAASDVAHAMEDCFVAAQKGKLVLKSDDIDVLLRGVDLLNRVSEATKTEGTDWSTFDDSVERLVTELRSMLEGTVRPATPSPTAPKTEAPKSEAPKLQSPKSEGAKAEAPLATPTVVDPTSVPPVAHTPVAAPVTVSSAPGASERQSVPVVRCPSYIDSQAAEKLSSELLEAFRKSPREIRLDLGETRDFDAVGLALFAAARSHAQNVGSKLEFTSPNQDLKLALRMVGLLDGGVSP